MSKKKDDKRMVLANKIDELRCEASRLNSTLATEEKRVQVLQSELTKRMSLAAARKVEITNSIRRLQEQIAEGEAKARLEDLWQSAANLDRNFSDAEMARLDNLSRALHPKFIKQNHESRSMTWRRMRQDDDARFMGRPYPNYVSMIAAWLRSPAPTEAA